MQPPCMPGAIRGPAWVLGLALLSVLPFLASALFEDQAGSFDWYRAHIGIPKEAAFHPNKPRLCMTTRQHVLGCLNLRDGANAWRKHFGDEPIEAFHLSERPTLAITLARNGTLLRAFETLEGTLKWEKRMAPVAAGSAVVAPLIAATTALTWTGASHTIVLRGGDLKAFDTSTGAAVLAKALPSLAASDRQSLLPLGAEGQPLLAIVGHQTGGDSVNVALVSPSSDVVSATVPAGVALSGVSALGPAGWAALSADFASVCTLPVAASNESFADAVTCTELRTLVPSLQPPSQFARLLPTAGGFVLSLGGSKAQPPPPGAALLKLSPSGELSLLQHYPAARAVTPRVATEQHGEVVALLEPAASGTLSVSVVSTATGAVVATERAAHVPAQRIASGTTTPELAQEALLGVFKKKDRSDGFRVWATWDDGQMALVQQGVAVWSRDEALATATASMFVDLPAPRHNATQQGVGAEPAAEATFNTRIRYQILGAKVQLKLATAEEVEELNALRALLSSKNQPVRDANGFRKIILVATAAGKVYALHNGDGRVLWVHNCAACAKAPLLLPWRQYHDTMHAPQVMLLNTAVDGTGSATILDVHTGAVVDYAALPWTADEVVRLQGTLHDGSAEQSVYLLVTRTRAGGTTPEVHLLPDTAAARALFASVYRSLYFWLADESGKELSGYGFDRNAAVISEPPGSPIPAVRTWQLSLLHPILTLAAVDASDPVQTSVKVLPDRSLKYKYLNPNTLLVISGPAAGSYTPPADGAPVPGAFDEEEDADDEELLLGLGGSSGSGSRSSGSAVSSFSGKDRERDLLPELTATLVDTVTGRILYRAVHVGASGPAVGLISENLVAYQYWDAVASRFVMAGMELFDATPREFNVLDYLFNPNSTQPISSYDATPLQVATIAFATPMRARALTTTRTIKGITSKMILMTTNTGQVYTVDRRWLDPRRPHRQKLTAEEMEERMIPYSPELPVIPHAWATLDKQVLGLGGGSQATGLGHVTTAASNLESTSLMFAAGVDMFYTRLAPAKAFDSLEDDFNYALLIVALIGLAVVATVMHSMNKAAALAAKWK